MHRTLLLVLIAAGSPASTTCPAPREISNGARLDDLAAQYLGSARYAISIALATNSRTAEGFRSIDNPDDLSGISRVCVPSKSEARELERSWQAYTRAVDVARLPRTSAMDSRLVIITPDQPVNVVAWMTKDQVRRLKTASGAWVNTAPLEIWVTVENHLREFCRAFVGYQHPDETKLTRRLEQRLGLPPASGMTAFVRIRLNHPSPDVIFRPCIDPAADHANCAVGPPSQAAAAYQQWFYQQYYSSYGQSLIGEFPWTSLGYTFDWAWGTKRASEFVRIGESEFVIPKGAPIQILEIVTTQQYCAP